jgi:hypothetical protein
MTRGKAAGKWRRDHALAAKEADARSVRSSAASNDAARHAHAPMSRGVAVLQPEGMGEITAPYVLTINDDSMTVNPSGAGVPNAAGGSTRRTGTSDTTTTTAPSTAAPNVPCATSAQQAARATPDPQGVGASAPRTSTDGEAKSGLYGSPSFGAGLSRRSERPGTPGKPLQSIDRRVGLSQSRDLKFLGWGPEAPYGSDSALREMFEPSAAFSALSVGFLGWPGRSTPQGVS